MYSRIITFLLSLLWLSIPVLAEQDLDGSWCLDEEEMIITFIGSDSVNVISTAEGGVSGAGNVEKADSIFIATLSSDELIIRMGYQFTWQNDSIINARPSFVTLNGDSVQIEQNDVTMKRCIPEK